MSKEGKFERLSKKWFKALGIHTDDKGMFIEKKKLSMFMKFQKRSNDGSKKERTKRPEKIAGKTAASPKSSGREEALGVY